MVASWSTTTVTTRSSPRSAILRNLSAFSRKPLSRLTDIAHMSAATLATATGPHIFWITSRAAGTAALFLSSMGVCVGLLISGRFVRGRGADLRPLHEALSIATIVALVIHALTLLGDKFLHPSLADVTIPFVSS